MYPQVAPIEIYATTTKSLITQTYLQSTNIHIYIHCKYVCIHTDFRHSTADLYGADKLLLATHSRTDYKSLVVKVLLLAVNHLY